MVKEGIWPPQCHKASKLWNWFYKSHSGFASKVLKNHAMLPQKGNNNKVPFF